MKANFFVTEIHVKPMVKKYIALKYGETIQINLKNKSSLYLYSFLSGNNSAPSDNKKYVFNQFNALSESFKIVIDHRDIFQLGFSISKTSHIRINSYYEREMLAVMWKRCLKFREFKKSPMDAVQDFCAEYNISVENEIDVPATLKHLILYSKQLRRLKPLQTVPLPVHRKQ